MQITDHSRVPHAPAILQIENLRVEFTSRRRKVAVLNGVDLEVRQGETLCVVGESGCGKSMTALAILGLIPSPPGQIAAGSIRYDGADLVALQKPEMQAIRGNRIAMIFQEPMTSLNPVFTVGEQIAEPLRRHMKLSREAARARSIDLLRAVGIPAPEKRAHEFPHQLSGGMRQRVMIAMALACEPDILIADEPTTALDVTVQAQIFDLLRELQAKRGTSIVLITHDMGTVSEMADRVIVMYAGRIIEQGTTDEVLRAPSHPYTRGLIACLPELGSSQRETHTPLPEIRGMVPALGSLGEGCAFQERCDHAHAACAQRPPMSAVAATHAAACWLVQEQS